MRRPPHAAPSALDDVLFDSFALLQDSANPRVTGARPEAAECPDCAITREERHLGPLWLPLPTDKEWKQYRRGRLADPWWEVRVLHEKLCPSWKRPGV